METFCYRLDRTFPSSKAQERFNTSSVLIQLFCGEPHKFDMYVQKIHSAFPKAILIGATTDGEIYHQNVLTHTTVAAITLFNKSEIDICYFPGENGRDIQKFLKPDTKAIIAFAAGLDFDIETFLKSLSLPKDVILAGGIAGDNGEFIQNYICLNNDVYKNGVVAAILHGKDLRAYNFYHFGWKALGIEHTITKAEGNRVYTIDGIPAAQFYGKYLGKDVEKELPKTGVEFPLLIKREGKFIARAVLKRFLDDSLVFAAPLPEGSKVYLGVGYGEDIGNFELSLPFTPESFFIYSCMARRRFAPDRVEKEIAPFAALAPTAGFFTYGEFFTMHRPHLLQETMTLLALSERSSDKLSISTSRSKDNQKVLWHFIDKVVKDYDKLNKILQEKLQREKELQSSLRSKYQQLFEMMHEGVIVTDKDFTIRNINKNIAAFFGKDAKEIVGKSLLKFLNIDPSLPSQEVSFFEDGKEKCYLVNLSRLDGEYLLTISDITSFKKQQRQLMEQAKLAQMGEMINMIAHQWRQPLNTLSALAINLELKNDMDLLQKDEISEAMKMIQNIVQDMSQTIDDFMQLANEKALKKSFSLEEVVQEVLHLIKAQLIAHDIEIQTEVENIDLDTYKNDLAHVLLNLLGNAKDALINKEKPRKIVLRGYEKDGECVIEVEDNGGGIDEKIADRIFEPYFTTKGPQKGTGLGLYMSKRIVQERLGGKLFFLNTQEGAKFIVTIPLEGTEDEV